MPGILGIVSEQSEAKLFVKMGKAINHYGYSFDQFEKEGIHLGRMHLNFVNKAPQPVFSADKRHALVMIGEIFSYKNKEAGEIGSDSEFLLRILLEDGLPVLTHINGHFCAAWYDFVERKLVLISDRFGTRPLYYALNSGRLLFAPEVKAILQDDIAKDLDYQAISHLLHFTHLFGHRTLFSGIHQLPEASYLVYQHGGMQVHKYWDYTFHEEAYAIKKLTSKAEEAFIEELDHLMARAMKRVMARDSGDILLSLSGGLDSRYVAAYAHRFGLSDLKAFTFGPENCEDQLYAKKVAGMLNMQHEAYEVLPDNIWKHAEMFAYYSDYMGIINGPVQGFAPLQEHYRKEKITLSSQMADAIFGGNLWRKKLQYLMQQNTFNSKAEDIVFNIFNVIDEALLRDLFTDDFYQKIREGYKEVPEHYISRYKHPLFTYINLLMNEHGRRGTLCGNLMNNLFIETRMPSYDNDLMEFAYALPLSMRFNQHAYRKVFTRQFPDLARIKRERYNLRIDSPDFMYDMRILENKVVNTIKRSRFKSVLSLSDRWSRPTYIDHNRWFKNELKDIMTSLLTDDIAQSRGIYKKGGIEKIIRDHQHSLTDNARLIWQIINLEYFFRKFVDG